LFTDIVGSTEHAARLGDRSWRDLLAAHNTAVRSELTRMRGREVATAGDGFLATFDGPARAIRCACAIQNAVKSLGISVRAGLHTGECELIQRRQSAWRIRGAHQRTRRRDGAGRRNAHLKEPSRIRSEQAAFLPIGAHALKACPAVEALRR
jgi:hypothetical protein